MKMSRRWQYWDMAKLHYCQLHDDTSLNVEIFLPNYLYGKLLLKIDWIRDVWELVNSISWFWRTKLDVDRNGSWLQWAGMRGGNSTV